MFFNKKKQKTISFWSLNLGRMEDGMEKYMNNSTIYGPTEKHLKTRSG